MFNPFLFANERTEMKLKIYLSEAWMCSEFGMLITDVERERVKIKSFSVSVLVIYLLSISFEGFSRAGGFSRRQITNASSAVGESDLEDGDESNVVPETQAVEETIETTGDQSDILEAETENIVSSVPPLSKIDTHKLDSLFSSAKVLEEGNSSAILAAETQNLSAMGKTGFFCC